MEPRCCRTRRTPCSQATSPGTTRSRTSKLKDLYGLRDGKIQKIQGQDGAQDIAAKPLIDSLLYSQYNATAFAVNLRGDQGAVVSTTRGGSPIVAYGSLLDRAANPNDKVEPIPVSGKVLRPSYDNDDNLWVLDRADSGNPRLRFRSADGKLHDVRTEFGGNTPLSLRMAPDGVRALLVMKRKSGITYVVTATVQTNDAKQLMLGEFRPLNLALTEISDASWNNLGILVMRPVEVGREVPAVAGERGRLAAPADPGRERRLRRGQARLEPEHRDAPGGPGPDRSTALAEEGPDLGRDERRRQGSADRPRLSGLMTFRDAFADLVLGGQCAGCERPGVAACAACRTLLTTATPFQAWPDPVPAGLPLPTAAAQYGGAVRGLILAHKEHSRYSLAGPLGQALALAIRRSLDSGRAGWLCPVPSTRSTVRQRGHDPLKRLTVAATRHLRRQGMTSAWPRRCP